MCMWNKNIYRSGGCILGLSLSGSLKKADYFCEKQIFIDMGLYDIMVAALKEHKAMTVNELGEYIRKNNFYKQKNGTPLKDSQVHARVHHRPDLFMKMDGKIMLFDPDVVIQPKNKALKQPVAHKAKVKINTIFGNIASFAPDVNDDWFHESNISRVLVDYLSEQGYEITKDNTKNIAEKGIDIIAEKDGRRELIEVKGYPSIYYKDAKKRSEGKVKKTKPGLQCTHWFDDCLSTTIKNYGSKDDIIAMAFPACDKYEALMYARQAFFMNNDLDIKVYFVKEDGNVVIGNMNKNLLASKNE